MLCSFFLSQETFVAQTHCCVFAEPHRACVALMTVASLQQLVEDYILKRLTLANVLDLLDFCREVGRHGNWTVFAFIARPTLLLQAEMMLPASSNMQLRCQEFVAATFSALADMHGVERLRSTLPQDM